MLPIKVALISKIDDVQLEELTRVANALSIQVSRDFSPVWSTSATVAAFAGHDHVPPGYWPIFIVDNLPPDEGGFHLTKHRQPFAEVESGDSWSLSASHELIEMLVDPSGNRLIAGPELTVRGEAIVENPDKRVEYLVEACDPCEAPDFAYLIEDVIVSDFFTPHFHDAVKSADSTGTRYSFTGALTKPREILKGGYISWSDPQTGALMQIKNFDRPELVNLSESQAIAGHESLREFAHRAGRIPPGVSKLSRDHQLAKMRAVRRKSIHTAAAAKMRAYAR